MKKLKYNTIWKTMEYDSEKGDLVEKEIIVTIEKENPSDIDIENAKNSAIGGVYNIEDDGQPEHETTEDVLNTLLGVM